MYCYEIYVSTNYGPYEPYDCGGLLLTYERAMAVVRRLTAFAGRMHRYEVRKVK